MEKFKNADNEMYSILERVDKSSLYHELERTIDKVLHPYRQPEPLNLCDKNNVRCKNDKRNNRL